ncbi:hypothetical protein DFP96_101358 [Listeria rocourtiae]|uniref:Uncharacterized protein n=1 Tax=Listeria rocourtiae TaxID=647910 RepID=A0A4R6ZRT3_9LIST|nr:hypothetical protein DFP96_101358 [Listeria rocourtiae]
MYILAIPVLFCPVLWYKEQMMVSHDEHRHSFIPK